MPDKVVDGEQVQDEVDQHQKQHLDHRMVQRFKHQNRNTIKKSKISLEIPKKNGDYYHQHKRLDYHHYRHMEVDELGGTD